MLAKLLSSLVLGEVVMPAGTYTVVDSGQLLLFLSSDNGVGWGHRTGLVHLFISLSILVSRLNPSPDLPSWLKPWRGTCNPSCLGWLAQSSNTCWFCIIVFSFATCHYTYVTSVGFGKTLFYQAYWTNIISNIFLLKLASICWGSMSEVNFCHLHQLLPCIIGDFMSTDIHFDLHI